MNSIEENRDQSGCSLAKKKKCDEHKSIDSEIINKKNFVKACEQVSQNSYLNYRDRLQVLFLPKCSDDSSCKHISKIKPKSINDKIKQIPPRAIHSIQIEISDNMWHEAVEIIFLSITPKQYLTASALRDIVGIMLNAHEDISSEYSVAHLISKCEQALALHFRMHPPCFYHENIINVYSTFLFGKIPDVVKQQHSNKHNYGWDKGIIQYCLNRLEEEISSESEDGPLIDVNEIIPEKFKEGTRRLHYQKEQLEIYELLERNDRIERLMAVLNSTMELLQFNLFIIKSRSKSRQKALITELFWQDESKNPQRISKITEILKQIMKLFACFVYLDYPEEHVQTMSIWLNMAIEAVYYNDDFCYYDYPTIGRFGRNFAEEFYKIIADLPHKSIVKVLERIQPSYMKYRVGLTYIKVILESKEDNIIKILINFLRNLQWKDFPKNEEEKNSLNKFNTAKVIPKNIIHHLSKICKDVTYNVHNNNEMYPKFYLDSDTDTVITQSTCITALYIILDAYLDAYSIQKVHTILEKMNDSDSVGSMDIELEKSHKYYVTERLVKVYKNIYQFLQELIIVLNNLKNDNSLPEELKVFENIFILELLNK